MSHKENRVIHDADAHLIEHDGWLESYATDFVKDNLHPGLIPLDFPPLVPVMKAAKARVAGENPELTEAMKANLFGHREKLKQWPAFGAFDRTERSESLDIMGLSSQLIFPTIAASRFARHQDLDVAYGGCDALNRAMADFCANDKRMLPVGFLVLTDPERALQVAKDAVKLGVKALWIGSDAVKGRAPSHIAYDPIWAVLEEAQVAVTLHIGSGRNMTEEYMNTGVEKDRSLRLSNIETTKPKDLNVIHHSPERWLTCMIYDGVLDRFPNLKIGLIELGANWVPAMLQNLDMGVSLLGKFDKELKDLSLKPSEFVSRQVRVTPLHTENTGWILKNVPKEVLMFNTDYPHPEGGSDPFGDFERSLDAVGATDVELDHFYSKNFEDLMGLST
ncbi:MAG: putative TIM-barrel fold metal-dependent hydrolase [Parasphingorhabdus sp.]|jgi:predicted TIM-barrel fold metal-dependent hydrolase